MSKENDFIPTFPHLELQITNSHRVPGVETFTMSDLEEKSAPPQEIPRDAEFELPRSFFKSITSDPVVRESIEKEINRRLEERIGEDLDRLKQAAVEEGHQEGFLRGKEEGTKEGIELGRSEFQKSVAKLSDVCEQILGEKEKVLLSHETKWCKAFSHLLKRFMVANSDKALEGIREWITKSLEGYASQSKVKIHISPAEYDVIGEHLDGSMTSNWEIIADPSLKMREISIETSDGGVFFSPTTELGLLDAWIDSGYAESPVAFYEKSQGRSHA